jgi:hypothetical protein
MKRIAVIVVTSALISGMGTSCFAMRCNCNDWMERGGYCVDYIKERIPSFPMPYKDDMPNLKNTAIANITEGDVAIFTIKNYWHVAYVERVHRNERGEATTIDVSEMNFGDDLSFREFKAKWKSSNRDEWYRASCCGVTDNYDIITIRKNVDLDTVKQIWSPDDVPSEGLGRRRLQAIAGRVREAVNRFYQLIEDDL